MPPAADRTAYGRVLLKLSGEALLGEKTFGIDRNFADYLAAEIREVHDLGVEVAVRGLVAPFSRCGSCANNSAVAGPGR